MPVTGLKRQEDLGGVEVVLLTALAGNARWEEQKVGCRLGTGTPKDLGAGLTSTPDP